MAAEKAQKEKERLAAEAAAKAEKEKQIDREVLIKDLQRLPNGVIERKKLDSFIEKAIATDGERGKAYYESVQSKDNESKKK